MTSDICSTLRVIPDLHNLVHARDVSPFVATATAATAEYDDYSARNMSTDYTGMYSDMDVDSPYHARATPRLTGASGFATENSQSLPRGYSASHEGLVPLYASFHSLGNGLGLGFSTTPENVIKTEPRYIEAAPEPEPASAQAPRRTAKRFFAGSPDSDEDDGGLARRLGKRMRLAPLRSPVWLLQLASPVVMPSYAKFLDDTGDAKLPAMRDLNPATPRELGPLLAPLTGSLGAQLLPTLFSAFKHIHKAN
ncbi:hypothetical protein BKA62DRAFT_780813 [Auriculariales sp. MPI-PUGE-AT-0066]|nr:hypothetical protein BKA62DRAFT_780813 [Auriculariales sp. MPI-PUGE-AT-0066]